MHKKRITSIMIIKKHAVKEKSFLTTMTPCRSIKHIVKKCKYH